MWQTNDSKWKTSIGLSSIKLHELGGRELPLNQCIGVVISSLRLDDATWETNFGSFSSSSSGSAGGWGNLSLGRTTRRLLDSILERPTDLQLWGDGMLLSTRPSSIYTDALPLFQITTFWWKNLNGIIFPDMNFDVLAWLWLGSVLAILNLHEF